jgi:ATP-dependent Clp protease ATP-binding subunit ClpA
MKLIFPVGIRHYPAASDGQGGDVVIAQTLCDPEMAGTGASPADALAELSAGLKDVLSRLHPRTLWTIWPPGRTYIKRRRLPVFRSAAYDWFSGTTPRLEETEVWLDTYISMTDLPGGILRIGLPAFGAFTSLRPDPDEHDLYFEDFTAEDEEESEDFWSPITPLEFVLDELITELRLHSHHLLLQRPIPDQFDVMDLEIEFEPLDLQRVESDALWSEGFEDEQFESVPGEREFSTPTLDRIAQCWATLTPSEADLRGIHEVFEREVQLEELRNLLMAKKPSVVVLVGQSRVGKTALIKHLAHEQTTQEKPEHRIWFSDAPRMVSTDPTSPGWQEQCRQTLAEIKECDDVLFMGRLIESLDAGKYVGSDYNLAQFLKPTLQDRQIRVVAEATVEEWNEVERRDVGFARCFTVIRIENPSPELSFSIVQKASKRLGARLNIVVGEEAITRAWGLQKRFATEGSPVGRTLDFVGRTVRQASNLSISTIDVAHMIQSFCQDTGLSALLLDDELTLDLDEVRARLEVRVMGQEEAVKSVADIVGITKAGLASEDRPLGSFLFVGPTGVGKTELARALASYLFGSPDRMIRLDMSEYSHADAYARLVGEGREDGDLTGPVRRQPFCVVLLDELEKAHQNVFDLLLQVLGEARLTDVKGKTTRFQNTIIVMTSNLGVDTLRPAIGFEQSDVESSYASHFRKEAERFFRPEFLARIDQFIPFRPLRAKTVSLIAARELKAVAQRDGIRAQDVDLEFGDRVVEWIATRGISEKYGARPLKRVLDQQLVWPLAQLLSDNRPAANESRLVRIDVEGENLASAKLSFNVKMVAGDVTVSSARQLLLLEIDSIAELRRRLQYYTFTNVFGDLEWEISHFDTSSLSPNFWTDPNAADHAARADRARKVVEPVLEISSELAALEDLANEAFHARTFALSTDLTDRIRELSERVERTLLNLLRGSYEDPDHLVVFLVTRQPEDPFRTRLVEWYKQRAHARGWTYTFLRPIPDYDRLPKAPDQPADVDRVFWEETLVPSGATVIAMEFEGFAVRPLMRAEDGQQRIVSSDGNGMIDVHILETYDAWPYPDVIEEGRTTSRVVRTYNFRTNEINMPEKKPIKLIADDPWRELEPHIGELVWELTEGDWD